MEPAPIRRDLSRAPPHGASFPLGATPCVGGVNFSVFSKHATGVELLLFDHADEAEARARDPIGPVANRTYHYWHVFVPGLTAGQLYASASWGLRSSNGMRFDPSKVLLDPYGRGVAVPEATVATLLGNPATTPPRR